MTEPCVKIRIPPKRSKTKKIGVRKNFLLSRINKMNSLRKSSITEIKIGCSWSQLLFFFLSNRFLGLGYFLV